MDPHLVGEAIAVLLPDKLERWGLGTLSVDVALSETEDGWPLIMQAADGLGDSPPDSYRK